MSTLNEIRNQFRDISDEHEAELKELIAEFDKEYERTLKEFERSRNEAGQAWGAAIAGRTVRHPITGEMLPVGKLLTGKGDDASSTDGASGDAAGTEKGRTSSADTAVHALTGENSQPSSPEEKPSAWPMGGVL